MNKIRPFLEIMKTKVVIITMSWNLNLSKQQKQFKESWFERLKLCNKWIKTLLYIYRARGGGGAKTPHFFENYKELLRKKCFQPPHFGSLVSPPPPPPPHFQSSSAGPDLSVYRCHFKTIHYLNNTIQTFLSFSSLNVTRPPHGLKSMIISFC